MPLDVPSNNEIEASTLMERAQKRATEMTLFGLMGSREMKLEEAAEMCAKAGNLYKIEKKWQEAGTAYQRAAEYAMQHDDKDAASSSLVEASKAYKKTSPELAVKALLSAVEMLKQKGRFHPAANHLKAVAEIYETDQVDAEKAMFYYAEAAEVFAGEDQNALANQCWLKVATFAAQLEKYDVAIEKFEAVATSSLDNNLTKFSAKQYFLNAGLCHMCKDPVGA